MPMMHLHLSKKIGHGKEPGAGQTEILIWSRNTHDMLWFVSLLLHVSLQPDFLSGKHGRHGRDGRGQGWVFCRSFMRTWLARRICESAGIAWIAIVFQVFSWTGGENAGTTETAQEGKSEYELELYGGAEDSSGAYVSRPVSSQVNLCILCEFMTRNFQDHLPVRVVEPLIKARKDLREKGEKAEETTCQWSGFGTFDLHFMIGHGTEPGAEPGAGQTEFLIWSRNTHDMLWFVSLLLHVSLQHDFLSGKHGRHGRDGRGQGWVFCRSFMRTWLARRICESAGIAWIAIVFQVFSWTGGENAGATETAQEGKSEYELELYGGAEDSSSAYMSQDLFHHKWIFAFCANLWPKTSRTICQWGSSNPWSRQEKIWGKREKKQKKQHANDLVLVLSIYTLW